MLLGPDGNPLRKASVAELQREIAAASQVAGRPVRYGYETSGMTPAKLGQLLRQADDGDTEAFLTLAAEMERKDLHFAAVLGVRKRAIRALDLVVEPGDESVGAQEAAEFVRAQLEGDGVQDDLQDVLDALGKGFSIAEIVWARDGARWEIGRLEWRDPRWFRFDREDGRTPLMIDQGQEVPLVANKFVVHLPRISSGLPIQGGLARLAAWGWLFKNFAVRDWAIFIEGYGHPLKLGKYDTSASEAERATLLRAVRMIGSADMAAIVPKTMELEFESGASGQVGDLFLGKAGYWDQQISKGVLGQTGTTDAIAGGHAVGRVHDQVRDDIRDADADQLAVTLRRDVATPLTRFNFGEGVPVPAIRFEAADEIPLAEFTAGVGAMMARGLQVRASDIYARYGLTPPEEGDDVLGGGGGQTGPLPELARALAAAQRRRDPDSVEALARAIEEEAFAAARPLFADIEAALSGAGSLQELRVALASLADAEVDDSAFVELLGRAMAAARYAGEAGARVR